MLLRARNSTTRPAGPGQPRAASTPLAMIIRRPCCPMAWCWWQGDLIAVAMLLRARNSTTRPAGPGQPRAASTPLAIITRRPCCPMAWCWWQGEWIAVAMPSASAELYDPASGTWTATGSLHTARVISHGDLAAQWHGAGGRGSWIALGMLLRARNSTTRPAGPGRPRAASTPLAIFTRRPCCPMAWCWWQGEWIAVAMLLRARNSTTRPAGPGQPRAASTPLATSHGELAAQWHGAGGRGSG